MCCSDECVFGMAWEWKIGWHGMGLEERSAWDVSGGEVSMGWAWMSPVGLGLVEIFI